MEKTLRTPLSAVLANKARGNVTHAVSPTMTVASAVELLNQNKVGSVLVIDEGRLVGIFTERDVLRRVVGERRDADRTTVAEVMTRDLVVMRPTSTVGEAMKVFSERRIRHLPVLDAGRLVGVVSQGDLNHWLIRDHQGEIQSLVEFVTGQYPA
jgi:CBS domain-containing protein